MKKDTQVIEVPVTEKVENTVDSTKAIQEQRANFVAQLEQVKKDMAQYQQAFETLKTKGIKLEGAIESLDILLKSLSPAPQK